jgi:hypothetical protein
MGGYISTYLSSAPATEVKDASGNTVPVPTDKTVEQQVCLPPAREEPQITTETKVEEKAPPAETPPPPPSPVPPIEEAHKPAEKTVTVDALPEVPAHKVNVNGGSGKNKKKGKKH